jgi:membrane protein implicated in regulation of membrane protease activity
MATPDKKDKRRPTELLGLSALLAVFMLIVVFMGSRDVVLALEFAGVGFIVALVVLAMLALAAKPKDAEQADLDEQNSDGQNDDRPRGH